MNLARATLADCPVVAAYAIFKGLPLPAGTTVCHEEMWAVLVRRMFAPASPMIVGHHIVQRYAVFLHQVSGEFCRTIEGPFPIVAAMLAHLYPNAVLVSRAVVIGMVGLLVRRHVLDGDIVLNGEVPGDPAQGTVVECPGMGIGIP